MIYADSTNTYNSATHTFSNGGSGYDRVQYSFDRQGEMTSMEDQAGTTHDYFYLCLCQLAGADFLFFGGGIAGDGRRAMVGLPGETEAGSAGTQPAEGYPGSSAPMGVRPLMTFCHQGPFLVAPWTLDSCLKKSTVDARQGFRPRDCLALVA